MKCISSTLKLLVEIAVSDLFVGLDWRIRLPCSLAKLPSFPLSCVICHPLMLQVQIGLCSISGSSPWHERYANRLRFSGDLILVVRLASRDTERRAHKPRASNTPGTTALVLNTDPSRLAFLMSMTFTSSIGKSCILLSSVSRLGPCSPGL